MILAPDEQAKGKVKIKEMGLPEDHPEKNGVEVDSANLPAEVKKRLAAKALREDRLVAAIDDGAPGTGVDVDNTTNATKKLEISQKEAT